MPYDKIKELPEAVRNSLPRHAQEIYQSAYNNARDQYSDNKDKEETAHRVAWSAVKQEYKKNNEGDWVSK